MKDEDYWNHSVEYFIKNIIGGNLGVRIYYLTFLVELHQLSNADRRRRLAIDLVNRYIEADVQQIYNGDRFTYLMFSLLNKSGLFADYYLLFKPILYKNDYNTALIRALIAINNLLLAEKYCLEQVQRNTQDEYNIEYYKLLAAIYTITKDDKKLAMVIKHHC